MTILAIIIFILALGIGMGCFYAAPWVTTKKAQREQVIKSIKPNERAHVYDIGSGDGTILFEYLERYPSVHVTGIEIAPIPYYISQLRRLKNPRKNQITFQYGDLYRADLTPADIIFVFLMEATYPKLLEKLRKEVKPETYIILEAWPFPDMQPQKHIKKEGLLSLYIYQGKDLLDNPTKKA